MRSVLMVIAPQIFRDEEYVGPKAVLEDCGVSIVTASTRTGPCTGKLGTVVEATIAVQDCVASDYDAVVFVGGGGAEILFDDIYAHRLARDAYAAGKVVAAICIAPSILARTGLLKGIRATAFASRQGDLVGNGAIWTGEEVTIDGRIVTANGPGAARAFGEAVGRAIKACPPDRDRRGN
jgi:protease I